MSNTRIACTGASLGALIAILMAGGDLAPFLTIVMMAICASIAVMLFGK